MNHEELKDMLMKKINQELFRYKQYLIKNKTSKEIIESAYEINFKEQIRDILEGLILDKQQIKVLLKTDNVIEKLYHNWEHSDGNIWEKLEDNICIEIRKLEDVFEKNKEKVR